MSEIKNNTVEGYELEKPDHKMAIDSLEKMVGKAEAEEIWKRVCYENEVPPNSQDIDELTRLYTAMSKEEGVVGVTGRSLSIRATSYRILSRIKNIK